MQMPTCMDRNEQHYSNMEKKEIIHTPDFEFLNCSCFSIYIDIMLFFSCTLSKTAVLNDKDSTCIPLGDMKPDQQLNEMYVYHTLSKQK